VQTDSVARDIDRLAEEEAAKLSAPAEPAPEFVPAVEEIAYLPQAIELPLL